jgi:hypothetical protein
MCEGDLVPLLEDSQSAVRNLQLTFRNLESMIAALQDHSVANSSDNGSYSLPADVAGIGCDNTV